MNIKEHAFRAVKIALLSIALPTQIQTFGQQVENKILSEDHSIVEEIGKDYGQEVIERCEEKGEHKSICNIY